MMKIVPFIFDDYDDLTANSYFLIDSDNNCVLIDPSRDYDGYYNFIKKNNLSLKGILLTHGHADHLGGVNRLLEVIDVPIYIGFDDERLLISPYLNVSMFLNKEITINHKVETLVDNQTLKLLNEDIVAYHTPYHTEGSFIFYLKDSKALFSGDSLFKGSIGRSDLPTGNTKKILPTLRKILSFPIETKVYPGHGSFTHIKDELGLLTHL